MKQLALMPTLVWLALMTVYPTALAWQTNINGTSTFGFDEAFAVTVDRDGNILAAGNTQNDPSNTSDFTVMKFDGASGAELWRQIIHGSAGGQNRALAIAVDDAGNVVAAGLTTNSGTGSDFTVIKFDGDGGAELWRQVIDGNANGEDQALAVAIGQAGNVIAAGFTTHSGSGRDFTVIKFDGGSGAEVWRQVIDGSANGEDQALSVTVGSAGNVIAAGFTTQSGSGRDFTVIKFDGGTELWRQVIDGSANGEDQALAVALGPAGNVIASGFTTNSGTGRDLAVIKFNGASGAELWHQVINGTGNAEDQALAVTVGSGGNVIAAGFATNSGTGRDLAVIKFNGASGAELWHQTMDGTLGASDSALAVSLGGAGNVLVGGFANLSCFERCTSDLVVIKLDERTGRELWQQLIPGARVGNIDEARAVTVGAGGSVVAVGPTTHLDTGSDFTVIQMDRSGEVRWRQDLTGSRSSSIDEAFAIKVDAGGNVVAAGYIHNAMTGHDFAVVKSDGATGAELWRQIINGTANGSDEALAVSIDDMGNVVAAGFTTNVDTGNDFTVLKFDGATGAELWRQVIGSPIDSVFDSALAVIVDAAGDVVAGGRNETAGGPGGVDFTVIKFAGASGAELWRYVIGGNSTEARAITVDAAGDVVAAGRSDAADHSSHNDFTVLKLDGANGTELWRQVINGTVNASDAALAVAVDAAGDVAAVGSTLNTGTSNDFTVVKFNGLTGTELWRQVINGSASDTLFDQASAIAMDAAGDIVVGGSTQNTNTFADFTVIKFDGASGGERWRQVINSGGASSFDAVNALSVDAAGNVVAAGQTHPNTDDFTVIKFDGIDGTELWRHVIPGVAGLANAVAVDAAGEVLAAGRAGALNTYSDFVVVKLKGADGSDF